MWMLYSEQHWTKVIDLKSAVEGLYEKFGALEFDADHEAIYGMERYYTTFDTMWKPRQIGSKTLTFEMTEEKKILKIEDMFGNEVYLGWESVSEVWSLESVVRYRLSYSSEMSGDVKINIYNIINRLSEKSDDVCCMLEVLLFMPEKALFDVQLERRIQEQGQKRVKKTKYSLLKKMWLLYAQEHWAKSYDLKSAVERLYEELGALEFDADHEAIYGMERYYTVQQFEELRDKYKIGRKLIIVDNNRLLLDELDYELLVRGVTSSGTVADKRKLLRSRINLEKITKTSSPNVNLNFGDELRVCDDKLQYIETDLSTFASGFSDNEYRRIRIRLLHLDGRIERIRPEDKSQGTRRNEVINRYIILFDDLETKF
ncbi:hypothetical protein FQA39_LY16001 [Lamprigera yunnana]|nr:hypothetical protein FQA39_LY16001 [Lamprigera yunnana]